MKAKYFDTDRAAVSISEAAIRVDNAEGQAIAEREGFTKALREVLFVTLRNGGYQLASEVLTVSVNKYARYVEVSETDHEKQRTWIRNRFQRPLDRFNRARESFGTVAAAFRFSMPFSETMGQWEPKITVMQPDEKKAVKPRGRHAASKPKGPATVGNGATPKQLSSGDIIDSMIAAKFNAKQYSAIATHCFAQLPPREQRVVLIYMQSALKPEPRKKRSKKTA